MGASLSDINNKMAERGVTSAPLGATGEPTARGVTSKPLGAGRGGKGSGSRGRGRGRGEPGRHNPGGASSSPVLIAITLPLVSPSLALPISLPRDICSR